MKKIVLDIVKHKGTEVVLVKFAIDNEIGSAIRQIKTMRWSATHKAWYAPYSIAILNEIKTTFETLCTIDAILLKEKIKAPPNLHKGEELKPVNAIQNKPLPENSLVHINNEILKKKKIDGVFITVLGKQIKIELPKNDVDTQFIISFRYARWDKKNYCWIVPNYSKNLDLIKEYFKNRIHNITEIDIPPISIVQSAGKIRQVAKDEIIFIKTNKGRIKIIFAFNKVLSAAINKLPYHYWDIKNKWYTIPYKEEYVNQLKELATSEKLKFFIEDEKQEEKVFPRKAIDSMNYKDCPTEYILKLKELRYSENTIKTYKNCFTEFVNYYHQLPINDIDEMLITDYLRYLVIERKVSSSYQNQAINAIKFYYERVLKGNRKMYLVERPREEKTLPTVLNEKEVLAIINATENFKHRAILMVTYSGGLRVSEVINLQLKDIDSKRMQIRIQQSKGKKDRYTLLSMHTLSALRLYAKQYKPSLWLFEGQKGEQYTKRSIQQIMQTAVKKVGIKKKVSVHTLRHSFATHLLENGTDLRYIQTLLGHESSKTTEIYTHITTKGFDQIKNPLDKLLNDQV